ncbi:MAG: type III-B CRISPR module RAMP protein Cmr1 [Thermoflexales bacterium]|nr:type III-B CRISPR module RAMP protein Cmr1 [Thermoflexales bacterium]
MTTPNRSISLTLEVISPMFLAGADPRGKPELRPPSLRGMLRYWLRALVGAAGLDVAQQHENRLFGVAGDKNAAAGAIALHIQQAAVNPKTYTDLTRGRDGAGYLWFAARQTKTEAEREAIPPGTRFTLQLSAPRSPDPQRDLRQTLVVLKVAALLGGIGNRSRRFAGAFQAVSSPDDLPQPLDPRIRSRSPEMLAAEIAQIIRVTRVAEHDLSLASPPKFDIIHPAWCEIGVSPATYRDVLDLIDHFGTVLMEFRREQPDAAAFARSVFQEQPIQAVKRPAFGLPIPFYYRDSNTNATLQASLGIDRRASPIWMQVVRLANGEHAAVFTWFRSQFLPPDAELVLKQGRRTIAEGAVPDQEAREEIIRDFLGQLNLIPVNFAQPTEAQ